MTLQEIEQIVLSQIGYDRYSSLSVDTNAEKIEDFARLHSCVNLAREEIKLNTKLSCLTVIGAGIVTTANTSGYSLPAGFDIPIAIYYWGTGQSEATLLKQLYMESLPLNVPVAVGSAQIATGEVYGYIIAGTSADLMQIYIVDVPAVAGVILPIYKPVLTELTTSTDEDILMRKYPKTVINFATAFAALLLKNDQAKHDKFYGLGFADCAKIDIRELRSDSNFKELPPASIVNARAGRFSK